VLIPLPTLPHNLLHFSRANTAAPKTPARKPQTASTDDFDEKIAEQDSSKKKGDDEEGDPQTGQVRTLL
jgi:hypothetical protein